MRKVMIHPATYETAREAVDHAFSLFPIEIEGKKVLLKPNVLRAANPEEGITTHPAVLAAVVDKVAGMNPAELIVGDNPGAVSYGANLASFEQAGLRAAAGKYYRNIGIDSKRVPFDPAYMETISVSDAVLDADVIISLPKFKTHGLTVLTGAIKNSYGFLPGAQKARLHKLAGNPHRFHEVVVSVFKLRVPDLFIMDAVLGMEGNGPASPDLRDIGLILAADNAVAMDAVVARLMGLDPAKLRFLQLAKAAGLGDCDAAAIEVIGELTPIPDFKVPPLGGEAVMENPVIQNMLESKTVLRPKADPDACTACGTCVEQCPVEALAMPELVPVVDETRCITCFCCQEMCPEKAIALA